MTTSIALLHDTPQTLVHYVVVPLKDGQRAFLIPIRYDLRGNALMNHFKDFEDFRSTEQ